MVTMTAEKVKTLQMTLLYPLRGAQVDILRFQCSKGKNIIGWDMEHFLEIFKLQVDEIILP